MPRKHMGYASGTAVPVGRTKGEIEDVVRRNAGTRFAIGWLDDDRATVSFVAHYRLVRFTVARPTEDDVAHVPPALRAKAVENEERRRWRCLLLIIKSKFEAIREGTGITTFDAEFLSHIVGAGGATVYEWIKLQEIEKGRKLLPEVR